MTLRPNVILVVLDTVRADHCSAFGYARETTPFLRSLAEHATVFTDAITNSPWTLPAHAGLFTGLLPSEHACEQSSDHLDKSLPFLPEILRLSGYFAVAVSCNSWISPHFGFARGFDLFFKTWQLIQADQDLARVDRDNLARHIRAYLGRDHLPNLLNGFYGRYLRKARDKGAFRGNAFLRRVIPTLPEPFFLFVNYLDAHLPYHPPRGWGLEWLDPRRRALSLRADQNPWTYSLGLREMSGEGRELLIDAYDAGIHYVDSRLEELCGALEAHSPMDRTLMVITSDHGDNLGEHRLMGHQASVHQTLLHVPLVVRLPGAPGGAGGLVESPVDLTQVLPTILEATGSGLGGRPGGPTLFDRRNTPRIAEYRTPRQWFRQLKQKFPLADTDSLDCRLRAGLLDRWKLVEDSRVGLQLFDLRADPGESCDVSGSHPDVVTTLSRHLADACPKREASPDREQSAGEAESDLDPRLRQRLIDLGYLE